MSSPTFPAGRKFLVEILEPAGDYAPLHSVPVWSGLARPIAVEEYKLTCGCVQIARKSCCVRLSRGGQPLATAWFTSDGHMHEELKHPAVLETGVGAQGLEPRTSCV